MGRRRGEDPTLRSEKTAVDAARALPEPYEALSDSPNLVDVERDDLAACEAAIDHLRVAFWAAGKALQVIRDAQLYRATHATFEDYLEERWQMKTSQAYRLIQAWPLAEILSPIGDKIINEGQVRELLPLAGRHGKDAAVTVYQTVAEADGVRVTAAVLKGAVEVLPKEHFDSAQAVEQIRAYLAQYLDDSEEAGGEGPAPGEVFAHEAQRLQRAWRRVLKRNVFRQAAHQDPEEIRKFFSEFRSLIDEAEQEALQQDE